MPELDDEIADGVHVLLELGMLQHDLGTLQHDLGEHPRRRDAC